MAMRGTASSTIFLYIAPCCNSLHGQFLMRQKKETLDISVSLNRAQAFGTKPHGLAKRSLR